MIVTSDCVLLLRRLTEDGLLLLYLQSCSREHTARLVKGSRPMSDAYPGEVV